ncbi:adenylyltransferase/cytidyltransferase family protein [Kordiimonas sp.]|uniref:adenylyltransferase/cytidyltransferase family protein n=1 Tax=Kordiimonas sp. TaxID=1970157 RepID=UPI003A91C169
MIYKKIITYGTFDMFHIGHLNLIKKIKEIGSEVIIGVSTDEFNEEKGKKCIIPYEQRAEIVRCISGVDLVIAESDWDQKVSDIRKYSVDCFVMGSDWDGKFDYLQDLCEVVYLPRTDGISTTEIKELLKGFSPTFKKDFNNMFNILDTLRQDLM